MALCGQEHGASSGGAVHAVVRPESTNPHRGWLQQDIAVRGQLAGGSPGSRAIACVSAGKRVEAGSRPRVFFTGGMAVFLAYLCVPALVTGFGFPGVARAEGICGFAQVSAGERHTCGVKTDGTVQCWGWNNSGQSSPPAGTFAQVSAGERG
ncbi:MAG: hypothetical protein KatS3mg077_1595 [Candidatus Binatia bacterium]|nr:MAG: hypothetical protein KatS3mg077_1595 [Candidatus Binatia bacterium]